MGISQLSIVSSDEKLVERVQFIHDSIGTDALVEQYIDGRELYVGMMGNLQLKRFPIWEMWFTKMPEGTHRIATAKIKWDENYQKKSGIRIGQAKKLDNGLEPKLNRICRRAYKLLGLSGYARLDLRVTDDGQVFLIEANPNPDLARGEEFAGSAKHMGIKYEDLLQKIVNLGQSYRAMWKM